jgi:hypothetical protein
VIQGRDCCCQLQAYDVRPLGAGHLGNCPSKLWTSAHNTVCSSIPVFPATSYWTRVGQRHLRLCDYQTAIAKCKQSLRYEVASRYMTSLTLRSGTTYDQLTPPTSPHQRPAIQSLQFRPDARLGQPRASAYPLHEPRCHTRKGLFEGPKSEQCEQHYCKARGRS